MPRVRGERLAVSSPLCSHHTLSSVVRTHSPPVTHPAPLPTTTMKQGGQPTRLYANGAILGYKRGLRNQYNHTSLIKIKGVDSKDDVEFYLGKRVEYITKVSTPGGKTGSKFRVNWGRVCRGHGSNGVVRCKFARDLPPQSIGGRVRVMLYPSRV